MDGTRQALTYRGGDVALWQRRLRRKLRKLLGEMPGKRVPLNVRTLWRRNHPLGTIEKIVFTSEPYADVPAYVCLPKAMNPPYAFMICLQGHTTGMHNSIGVDQKNETGRIKVEGDRDFALGCMSRALGAEKHCHLVVGHGGHRFYARLAWPKALIELKRLQSGKE